MAKVIIIQGGSFESFYEQTLDYLHRKYHTYPGDLGERYIPPEAASDIGYWARVAEKIAEEGGIDGTIPLGKLVL